MTLVVIIPHWAVVYCYLYNNSVVQLSARSLPLLFLFYGPARLTSNNYAILRSKRGMTLVVITPLITKLFILLGGIFLRRWFQSISSWSAFPLHLLRILYKNVCFWCVSPPHRVLSYASSSLSLVASNSSCSFLMPMSALSNFFAELDPISASRLH